MRQKVEQFSVEDLVYLLALHACSLWMETTKSCQYYVGPLVMNTVLYSIYYKLRDFENRVLVYMFYIN